MRANGLVYGVGALGVGLVCLAFGDFALTWQPVPQDLPGRQGLAYLSAGLVALAAAASLMQRTALWGALGLAVIFGFFALGMHGPRVLARPDNVGAWLGFTESLSLAIAGAVLALMRAPERAFTAQGLLATRILYGLCPLVFGLAHFVYVDITAEMVPGWLPAPYFWAYATGVGHVAAGLGIVSGVFARLAATCLAGMMACFVILLHIPRLIADPTSQLEWTMTFIAITLTGAAWVMRSSLSR